MSGNRMLRALAAGALLFACTTMRASGAEWHERSAPPFRILYQAGNGTEAAILADRAPGMFTELQSELGIRFPGTITVRILPVRPDSRGPSVSVAPHWAVGYVVGDSGEVVLRGEDVRAYPFEDLLSLLAHEITHVLLNSLPAAGTLPHWFHEGVAVTVSRQWSLRDALTLGTMMILSHPAPLRDLTASFPEDPAAARAAYAESFHFVSFLEREYGPGAVRRIIGRMKGGEDFPLAFRSAVGRGLPEVEAAWRGRISWAYRWIPALTSTGVLWIGITLLVLLSRLAKRRRERALLEAWDRQGLR